ncbi:amidohydrolase family protein [Desulfobacterales bacterium HSG16]|nr:amidohydrolase family protein [Desulfobacterales bacterium HSG16]
MIIDFHTHLFSKRIRAERESFFPGEPAFKLLYDSPRSKIVGADELVRQMDEDGIDKSVIFGFPWTDPAIYIRENDFIMEAVSRYPDRLIGFGCFDPCHEKAGEEAARCLDHGLSGIGELAIYQSGIDQEARDRLEPVMDICRKKDVPVLIHTNEPVGHMYPGKSPNTLSQIYKTAKRYPDNRIIFAHWGGGIFFFLLLKKEAGDVLKNVWYDTAASPFLYQPDIFKHAMRLPGCREKILFGTDYPLLKSPRYFKELEKSGIAKSDIELICGTNAAKVLKIPIKSC